MTPEPPTTTEAASRWVADPSNPVPTLGGNVQNIAPCGPQDQRPLEASHAAGMALFTSPPVSDVGGLLVHGMVVAHLWVTSPSNATDMDVAVKVSDVWPGGESMLMVDGVLRMRWRGGPFSPSPQPMLPGAVYPITVEVGWTSQMVNAGHRIRLAVSGSNAPRFSVNSNTGAPLGGGLQCSSGSKIDNRGDCGGGMDVVVAVGAVLTDAAHPSVLVLPTLGVGVFDALRLVL